MRGNRYSKFDVEYLNAITETKLTLINLQEKINKRKNQHKKWNYADSKYIADNWGALSVEVIAEHLHRTKESVRIRAFNLGLREEKIYTDIYSLCDIISSFKFNLYQNYTWFCHLIEKHGCPIIDYRGKKAVRENEFLEWLKNHLQLIDIYKDLPFKNPPEWLIEKQKADKRAFLYINKRNWTDKEDKLLIDLINKGYGYRDIGIKLKRTNGALKRRFKYLGLKIRPKRVQTKHIWTDEEISFIRDLYKKGYKACVIQEFLPPHSEAAINGIIERNNYFGEVIRFRKEN